ncbi:MAG: SAM-dependent methyltransferase, partial [Burkholderiales bacterium]|nr:SAM-dependent methyltransferase [Burkholderiales bacterium]
MKKKSGSASKQVAPEAQEKHEIRPGQSLELLKELHILTR